MSNPLQNGDERCKAITADGQRCENPATEGDFCWIEGHNAEGEGETEGNEKPPEGDGVPDREHFGALGAFIVDVTGYKPKEGDTMATQAAKAYLNEVGAGKEGYVQAFGKCPKAGCSYGVNGYESTHCRKHEGEGEGENDEKSPEGDGVETKADFAKALINDGVNPAKAAEKANEVWGEK